MKPRSSVGLGGAQRVFVSLVAAGVLLTIGGLVGASFVRSPADVALAQKPPPPDVLTAEVTRQRVASTIVTRGTVTAQREISFTPETAWGATRLVVSARPPAVGSRVRTGDLLTQVSGRPVFVLTGGVPAYRDLHVGDTGTDVAQLRGALDALGYSSGGDPATRFGPATASAVTRFYAAHGMRVATVGAAAESEEEGASKPEPEVLVPLSELFYVPTLPAVLTRFDGRLGSTVTPPLAAVQSGRLTVEVRLGDSERGAVDVGQAVEVEDPDTGKPRAGRVVSVGATVTPDQSGEGAGSTEPYVPVRVRTNEVLPPSSVGADVKVTIVQASTKQAVIAVPVAAVMTAADGDSYVVLVGPGGEQSRVSVRTGVTGEGIVEVDTGGRLRAGQRVVVGA